MSLPKRPPPRNQKRQYLQRKSAPICAWGTIFAASDDADAMHIRGVLAKRFSSLSFVFTRSPGPMAQVAEHEKR